MVGGAFLGGAIGGIIGGVAIKEAMIPNDIYLPSFSITAEEIFRNDIYLFDVDFFGVTNKTYEITKEITKKENVEIKQGLKEEIYQKGKFDGELHIDTATDSNGKTWDNTIYNLATNVLNSENTEALALGSSELVGIVASNGWEQSVKEKGYKTIIDYINRNYNNVIPTNEDSLWSISSGSIQRSGAKGESLKCFELYVYFYDETWSSEQDGEDETKMQGAKVFEFYCKAEFNTDTKERTEKICVTVEKDIVLNVETNTIESVPI